MRTKLLLAEVAALFLATGTAHAQSFFGSSDGGMGRYHGIMPKSGPYRPINISPATGRTYSTEADYKTQRRACTHKIAIDGNDVIDAVDAIICGKCAGSS